MMRPVAISRLLQIFPGSVTKTHSTFFSKQLLIPFRYQSIAQLHVSRSRKMTSEVVMNESEDMPIKKKIGLIQMTCTAEKEANFIQAKTLIQQAKILGAEMVFLPECCDYVGQSQNLAVNDAETVDGETISMYRDLAKEQNLWLSLGGFHEKPQVSPEDAKVKIYNTHLIIDNEGEIKGKYSKAHLFNVDIKGRIRLQETDFTLPGNKIGPPVDTPVGKVGMAICYDLRFPELSIALAQQGADILTFPSAFTVPTGKVHWETLLKCRALENQCYVVAAAQVGKHNDKRSSYGHAMVVDPWGTVIAECPDKPHVLVTEIDHSYMHKVREEMPVWEHRRHDLYGTINITSKDTTSIDSQPSYKFGSVTVICSQVFHRSDLSFAFVNKKPVVPGHVLVSPIRPVARYCDLTPPEVSDLFQLVQRVSSVIEQHYGTSSMTCAIQDGPDAGQTIQHVHVHILPRKPGDFKKNDDVYYELDKHNGQMTSGEWRTDEDMSAEATILRPYFTR